MTWEIAAFAVLFAALACGFAWYERTHPGSRMLALVATLAALAALGRIAFAPLPNVGAGSIRRTGGSTASSIRRWAMSR